MTTLLPNWRQHSCLLHVLTVLAANMPSVDADWGLGNSGANYGASFLADFQSLLRTLPLARSYDAAARAIQEFVGLNSSNDSDQRHASRLYQTVLSTIDQAAAIMRVKSTLSGNSSSSSSSQQTALSSVYSLDACLQAFDDQISPALEAIRNATQHSHHDDHGDDNQEEEEEDAHRETAEAMAYLWSEIKYAIELALPPSVLLLSEDTALVDDPKTTW